MRFSQTRPVKIVQLGAGGTGGHIAPHLYRLLYSLDRPVRYIICDGDVVEQKNLVRQNFTPADLGENKAQVLAERYSSVFGMETEYVPDFVEDEDRLKNLLTPMRFRQRRPNSYREEIVEEMVILLGAVDNNKSRQLCHRVFTQAKELIYIDSGNGEYTGQVICGVRRGGKTYFPPSARSTRMCWRRRTSFPRSCPALRHRCQPPRAWQPTSPPPPLWWT